MDRCRAAAILVSAAMALVPAMTSGAEPADPAPLRLSGLKGCGLDTPGGRGGRVLRVMTLDADGPGSLREALRATGPRIVVFEVGGVVDLGGKSLSLQEPFVTVAGQTAPAPGVTLIRGGLTVATHDVILRHLAVRPGDAGRPKKSGWSPDGITTAGAHRVVVDHCSATWAVDENLSVSGERCDDPAKTSSHVTLSHCLIAEGLNDSSHEKGPHSKGTLVHDGCQDIAVVGCLYAHNVDRNPYFKAYTTGLVVNNLIYNPGRRGVLVNWVEQEWQAIGKPAKNGRISVVGNVMLHGADTRQGLELVSGDRGDVFLEDNVIRLRDGTAGRLHADRVALLKERPCWIEGLTPVPSAAVEAYVLRHAGARPRERDAVDARIVREIRDRQGRIIDSQDAVGGYPKVEPVRRPLEIPADGVDGWLDRMAAGVE